MSNNLESVFKYSTVTIEHNSIDIKKPIWIIISNFGCDDQDKAVKNFSRYEKTHNIIYVKYTEEARRRYECNSIFALSILYESLASDIIKAINCIYIAKGLDINIFAMDDACNIALYMSKLFTFNKLVLQNPIRINQYATTYLSSSSLVKAVYLVWNADNGITLTNTDIEFDVRLSVIQGLFTQKIIAITTDTGHLTFNEGFIDEILEFRKVLPKEQVPLSINNEANNEENKEANKEANKKVDVPNSQLDSVAKPNDEWTKITNRRPPFVSFDDLYISRQSSNEKPSEKPNEKISRKKIYIMDGDETLIQFNVPVDCVVDTIELCINFKNEKHIKFSQKY
jgi:hypothetical protein